MTVAELKRRMGSREFGRWIQFYRSEPFGPTRDNLHAGIVASMIYNANRGKRNRPLSAEDFLLMSQRERMERNTKKTLSAVKSLAEPKRKRKKRRGD